jgi:hypothetical protein
MPEDINKLVPQRGLIDLSNPTSGDFGLDDYNLKFVFDDIVLVEYVDTSEDGGSVMRNGLYIPVNTLTKAWRKAKVILTGPNVQYAKVGDVVIFPNNLGVTVSNLDVEGVGRVKSGVFLNENRIFGICSSKQNDGI